MGIHDREYYRRSTGGSAWLTGLAPVTKWLILINIAVYLLQKVLAARAEAGDSFDLTQALEVMPAAVVYHFQVWRLVTGAFLHDPMSIWHIVFNMLLLWWCGTEVERIYGSREFLGFYLVAAVCASLSYVAWAMLIGHPNTPCIGASGAVYAVIVVYVLYNPRQVLYLFGLVPMEARWLLAGYVAFDVFSLYSSLTSGIDSKVAVTAHLGGALYGLLYKVYDLRIGRWWSPGGLAADRRLPPVPHPQPPPDEFRPTVRMVPPPDPDLEGRTDAILEKISREGTAALTDEERRILAEASRRYKDRTRRV